MHKVIVAAVVVLSMAAAGAEPVSSELATKYIEASKFEEIIKASIDEYKVQLVGERASGPEVDKLRKMLEDLMGWDTAKVRLTRLVMQLYTREEVEAYLSYLATPAGASMVSKSEDFSRRWTSSQAEDFKKLMEQFGDQNIGK